MAAHTSFSMASFIHRHRACARFSIAALLLASTTQIPTAYSSPEALDTQAPSTLTAPADPTVGIDVTERDSQLRNTEEELLKKLSLGAQPTGQESTVTIIPDIRHVDVTPKAVETTKLQPVVQQVSATATPAPQPQPKVTPVRQTTQPRYTNERQPKTTTVVPISSAQASAKPRPSTARASSSSRAELEQRVTVAESQVALLSDELEKTQRKLSQREEQLAHSQGVRGYVSGDEASGSIVSKEYETFTVPSEDEKVIEAKQVSPEPLPMARVTKDKTPLRIGPGSKEASLLPLSKNSVVAIEHRTGTWYRVVTSSGRRGWVSGQVLVFDLSNFPGSTDQVRAYDPRLEPTEIKF
jgi:hypothetical protein